MNTVKEVPVNEVIASMLKENTGKHMLDSGFENGRMWQRNQNVEFENTPRVEIEWTDGKFDYATVSAYHYLSEVLEFDWLTEIINEEIVEQNYHWVQDVDLDASIRYEEHGEVNYIDVEEESEPFNSYNYENNLSQVILWKEFECNGDKYCLLQIHGGADVRGGYTDVKCFKLKGYLSGLVDVSLFNNDTEDYVDLYHMDIVYNDESITSDELEDIVKENEGWDADFMIMEL